MDRGTYNKVVRDTDQEQLLMNIVRGRYIEVSQYIQIGSLTASYSLNQSVSGGVSAVTSNLPAVITSSVSPTVSYSDTPTISYVPLSNIEFAKSLMVPVTMSNMLLLAHAGQYDHTMLFPLFFEQIGDIESAPLNVGGVNHITRQFLKFNCMMDLLGKMFRNGAFEKPRAVIFEKQLGAFLRLHKNHANSPDALKLKKLLRIPLHSRDIIFMEQNLIEELKEDNDILSLSKQDKKPRNVVYVRLRSVYAIIDLLGRGVKVPCEDIKAHMTRELVNPNGSRYDWSNRMKNILTVYSSDTEPKQDFLVKIFDHNHWFYIKATDQTSKDTFDAVLRVLTLTSAVAASNNNTPILTIPITAAP